VLSTSFRLLLIVGPLLLARPAAALTVDVASIRLDPRASDTFHLAGRFHGPTLEGATTVLVSLGGLTTEVPVAYVAALCNIDTQSQDPSACRPATGNNP
jgi:hypothetical protein